MEKIKENTKFFIDDKKDKKETKKIKKEIKKSKTKKKLRTLWVRRKRKIKLNLFVGELGDAK